MPFCLWCKSSKQKKTNHKNFLEHLHLKMTRFPSSPRECHANTQWISRQRTRHSVILWNDGIRWPEHQAKHVHIHNCMPHDVYSPYIFLWNRDRFAVVMIKAFDCAFEHFNPIMCVCVYFFYFYLLFSYAIFFFLERSYIVSTFCWFAAVNTVSSSVLLSFPHSQSLSTLRF